jgi:uncharacterized protein YdaT
MKWTFENFEADLQDLTPEVKEKALEIAHDLMEKGGYSEKEALEEAIKEAEEWFLNSQG